MHMVGFFLPSPPLESSCFPSAVHPHPKLALQAAALVSRLGRSVPVLGLPEPALECGGDERKQKGSEAGTQLLWWSAEALSAHPVSKSPASLRWKVYVVTVEGRSQSVLSEQVSLWNRKKRS